MAKKVKQHNNKIHIYILVGVFLVAVLFLFNSLSKNQTNMENPQVKNNVSVTPSVKTYHSKFLEITIDYPAGYNLEERFGTIFLKKSNSEIVIDRLSTNFETIDEYLNDISEKNKLTIRDKKNIIINEQEAVVAFLQGYKDEDKSYFFYPEQWSIYSLNAKNPDSYLDLDQIARSFRYEP